MDASCRDDRLTSLVQKIQGDHAPVIVVSPHLDDAIFSCGALISHLIQTCQVAVLTVFSAAAQPARWGFAARKQLHDLGVTDADALFEERRAEDIAVLKELGAKWIHLGLRDVLFRRAGETPTGPSGTGRAAYPTYRFHVVRGRISRSDDGLAAQVSTMIAREAAAYGSKIVFGPLGVGRHVDHLITRDAVAMSGLNPVYYSDFPYSETSVPDSVFVQNWSLESYSWLSGRAENAARMAGYRTQFPGLFPHGVPLRPETYWISA